MFIVVVEEQAHMYDFPVGVWNTQAEAEAQMRAYHEAGYMNATWHCVNGPIHPEQFRKLQYELFGDGADLGGRLPVQLPGFQFPELN